MGSRREVNGKTVTTFANPLRKMFDGKEYTLHSSHQTIRNAHASAKIMRQMGRLARVDLQTFSVWVR